MNRAYKALAVSVDKKLKSNGYYDHTPQERTDRIQKAFSKIDRAMRGISLKHPVQEYLGR